MNDNSRCFVIRDNTHNCYRSVICIIWENYQFKFAYNDLWVFLSSIINNKNLQLLTNLEIIIPALSVSVHVQQTRRQDGLQEMFNIAYSSSKVLENTNKGIKKKVCIPSDKNNSVIRNAPIFHFMTSVYTVDAVHPEQTKGIHCDMEISTS